jgi:NAD+ diphosphatase
MSPPNTFTGAALDRAGEHRRDPPWLAEQAADPAARAVVAGESGVLVEDGRLALVPLAEAGTEGRLLLGVDDIGPVFAAHARDGQRLLGLRESAATLPQADSGLAAYAAAMLGWHRRHRFCANCGHATDVREAGHVRVCPNCGAEHHPRTDPVVIMLVTDSDERLMLGRQAAWPTGRYSALAGFVAPGESLEEAVAREVREETGVAVGRPCYVDSQPWPFPASLMLGFSAPWLGGEPRIADGELQDARWFDREEIERAAAEDDDAGWGTPGDAGGPLKLPPRLAIARRLVEHWLLPTTG